MYSNRAAEAESLPPTSGSLMLHIRRAHFIAMIWRQAGVSHQCLPSPAECGWDFDESRSQYTAIRCLSPPAPQAVMYFVQCGCKCGCKGRCSCQNNNIPCTKLCGCVGFGCTNQANSVEQLVIDIDEDE